MIPLLKDHIVSSAHTENTVILYTHIPIDVTKASNGGDYYAGYVCVRRPSGYWIGVANHLLHSDFEDEGWWFLQNVELPAEIRLSNEEMKFLLYGEEDQE